MRKFPLLFILLLPLMHASAAPMKFVEHNFSIEMPPGWGAIVPQPPNTFIAVRSPSKAAEFLVFAQKTQSLTHPNAAREVRNDVKENMTKVGYKIDPEKETSIGGMTFVAFVAHTTSGGAVTVYTAKAGDQVYMIQAISKTPDATEDAQLQAAVQSFQLLAPTENTGGTAATASANSAEMKTFVRIVLVGMMIIAAVMLFRRFTMAGRR